MEHLENSLIGPSTLYMQMQAFDLERDGKVANFCGIANGFHLIWNFSAKTSHVLLLICAYIFLLSEFTKFCFPF